MTTYDNLPVYKTSYDLLVEIFKFVKTFSREYKYTLWESIKNETIKMITNIYKANWDFEKRKYNIFLARENIEVVRLYLRLTKDLKQIDLKTFMFLNLNIESISKQLSFWDKKS